VARWFRSGLAVSGPFSCRCLSILTVPRFHIPLIKPDMQISRIRLTPVSSSLRIRQVTARDPDIVQTKGLVEILGREPF
jgi:hypothetical protein